jgi:hypothetical protein
MHSTSFSFVLNKNENNHKEIAMNIKEINIQLKELAYKKAVPFCYGCYMKSPTGACKHCGSDDLMLCLDGVGVEYGHEWVIESILEEELEPVDISESFEQMIEDCYGETVQIGFIESFTVVAMKNLDPIAWDIAKGEHLDSLKQDGEIIEVGTREYWKHEIEGFLS